uniref:Uncharacterized protein n=1 Tax=Cutavirus TaxID=1867125 RepID=A0A1B0YD23_9VIRU|nr:hypothetical protein [Cutavirus]
MQTNNQTTPLLNRVLVKLEEVEVEVEAVSGTALVIIIIGLSLFIMVMKSQLFAILQDWFTSICQTGKTTSSMKQTEDHSFLPLKTYKVETL